MPNLQSPSRQASWISSSNVGARWWLKEKGLAVTTSKSDVTRPSKVWERIRLLNVQLKYLMQNSIVVTQFWWCVGSLRSTGKIQRITSARRSLQWSVGILTLVEWRSTRVAFVLELRLVIRFLLRFQISVLRYCRKYLYEIWSSIF